MPDMPKDVKPIIGVGVVIGGMLGIPAAPLVGTALFKAALATGAMTFGTAAAASALITVPVGGVVGTCIAALGVFAYRQCTSNVDNNIDERSDLINNHQNAQQENAQQENAQQDSTVSSEDSQQGFALEYGT